MKLILIIFLFALPIQQVFSKKPSSQISAPIKIEKKSIESHSKIKKNRKEKKKIERINRKVNSTEFSEEEIKYQDAATNVISELKALPQICKESISLVQKTKKFKKKLNELKIKAFKLRELRQEYGIFFGHPLDDLFPVNIFITYVYEDRFYYNFKIPLKEENLREILKDISVDFQLLYRANFMYENAKAKDFPIWARYIALSLECLSKEKSR